MKFFPYFFTVILLLSIFITSYSMKKIPKEKKKDVLLKKISKGYFSDPHPFSYLQNDTFDLKDKIKEAKKKNSCI